MRRTFPYRIIVYRNWGLTLRVSCGAALARLTATKDADFASERLNCTALAPSAFSQWLRVLRVIPPTLFQQGHSQIGSNIQVSFVERFVIVVLSFLWVTSMFLLPTCDH